jgi:glycosyltransferase involved in cell wall biosynthesis
MIDRPRILLLTNSLAVGGAETQLVRLAVHLHAAGYRVRVATILPDGRDRRELRDAGIPHEVLPLHGPVPALTVLTGAIRLFRTWKPDAVISFLFYANVLGRLAGFTARTPVISSVRTLWFGGRSSDLILRLTDRLARFTVTNSHTVGRRLVTDRIVAADRVRVIPNAIPLELVERGDNRDGVRRDLGLSTGDFFWLAVGRLERVKDYPSLLRAMVLLRDAAPSARLMIAAEGSQRSVLEGMIRDLGLSGIVRLLGSRGDVPELLAAADALVHPSLWEGLPNTIIEAMAAALPVVATNRGGTTELVEPGVTGILVPPQTPRALAAAMNDVMQLPPDMQRAMGAIGRRRVIERFANDRVMSAWETLIEEVTSQDRTVVRPMPKATVIDGS